MTWQGVDITTGGPALSIWPPVIYYFVSIIVGGGYILAGTLLKNTPILQFF
ncbi:hypothetical protein [Mangrovibacter sp. MFB070]|uniref:hypothetical protein n=1 Tax=Mangrovibacter sp. MFB070 TaxID=1224318 RepID=UPI00136407FF|nr:hypothetical protein [Mangrovibacter sp. MFB070]